MAASSKQITPLSDDEIELLESMLEDLADMIDPDDVDARLPLSLDAADGLFAALALSPSITAIGDWMPLVMGDASFEDKDLTQKCRNLLIRHNNAVIYDLRKTDMAAYMPCISLFDTDDDVDEAYDVRAWCSGFALGYERQEEGWAQRMDEAALSEVNAILALKEIDEFGEIPVSEDMGESELVFRDLQLALVDVMRTEVSEMMQEEADNLTLLLFALKGLQTVMLAEPKPKALPSSASKKNHHHSAHSSAHNTPSKYPSAKTKKPSR